MIKKILCLYACAYAGAQTSLSAMAQPSGKASAGAAETKRLVADQRVRYSEINNKLRDALLNKNFKTAQEYLKAGANPQVGLVYALQTSNIAGIKFMLSQPNIDVNKPEPLIMLGGPGATPLQTAVANSSLEAFSLLLGHAKLNVNSGKQHILAQLIAQYKNNNPDDAHTLLLTEKLKLLLAHGSNPFARPGMPIERAHILEYLKEIPAGTVDLMRAGRAVYLRPKIQAAVQTAVAEYTPLYPSIAGIVAGLAMSDEDILASQLNQEVPEEARAAGAAGQTESKKMDAAKDKCIVQ